ncbi:MAG TPA: hypothetical protein VEH07_08090 [Alphaproteobacteria bacterium]|nr:hypothetical protein [Alphaproteobacteria bacterium]
MTLGACEPTGPTSENPIQSNAVADDGSKLLGAWHGELDGSEVFVHVVNDGRDSLQTLVIGRENGGSTWAAARALPADINGTGYLSIEVLQDRGDSVSDPLERGYHLLRYRTGPEQNYVTLYALDEGRIDKAIQSGEISGDPKHMRLQASSQDLIHFIESHAGQDLFSVQIGYFERVSEDALPKSQPLVR